VRILRRLNLYLFIVLLLSVLTSNIAIANTQSVCINKKTGEIRVSENCKSVESKGTRSVKKSKPTKVEVLQKIISSLELEILSAKKDIESASLELENPARLQVIGAKDINQANQICNDSMPGDGVKTACSQHILITRDIQGLEKRINNRTEKLLDAQSRLQVEVKGYKTIICKKGSETLTITDAKPKCPKGYK